MALTGIPDTITLTCTWNNNHLTFLYKDWSCNSWRQYQLAEQYVNKTSCIIPYSEGMLPPLVTENSPINQEVLLFHPTYFLLPSAHQLFVDLHSNVTYPMITDDIVIYHASIYSARGDDETDIKMSLTIVQKVLLLVAMHWGVYLVVVVVIIMNRVGSHNYTQMTWMQKKLPSQRWLESLAMRSLGTRHRSHTLSGMKFSSAFYHT